LLIVRDDFIILGTDLGIMVYYRSLCRCSFLPFTSRQSHNST